VPDLTPYNAGQIRRIQGQDGRYIGLSWAATGRRLACAGWAGSLTDQSMRQRRQLPPSRDGFPSLPGATAFRPLSVPPRLCPGFSAPWTHPRGNNLELCPRTQHEDPFLGMVATTEARGTMRSYLKIVLLIVGLVGAYLALLPLIV